MIAALAAPFSRVAAPPNQGGGGGGQDLTPLFFSDWRTQSNGSTSAILRDTILGTPRWDGTMLGQSTNNGAIIDNPGGLGFPTHKLWHLRSTGSGSGASALVALIGELAEGQTRNIRWYYSCLEQDGLDDDGQHPNQDGGSVSSQNWAFNIQTRGIDGGDNRPGAGTFALQFSSAGDAGNNNGRWRYGSNDTDSNWLGLAKSTCFRFERQEVRLNATTYRKHLWVYNAAGVLLLDDSNFNNTNGSVNLATNPTLTYNDAPATDHLEFGCSGIGGPVDNAALVDPPGGSFWDVGTAGIAYQAGVAVVDGLAEEEEIGAYGVRVIGEVLP